MVINSLAYSAICFTLQFCVSCKRRNVTAYFPIYYGLLYATPTIGLLFRTTFGCSSSPRDMLNPFFSWKPALICQSGSLLYAIKMCPNIARKNLVTHAYSRFEILPYTNMAPSSSKLHYWKRAGTLKQAICHCIPMRLHSVSRDLPQGYCRSQRCCWNHIHAFEWRTFPISSQFKVLSVCPRILWSLSSRFVFGLRLAGVKIHPSCPIAP